jgi:hypothetical protein
MLPVYIVLIASLMTSPTANAAMKATRIETQRCHENCDDNASSHKMTLSINPFALLYDNVSVSVEVVLGEHEALIFNPTYIYDGRLQRTGLGGAIGLRIYPQGRAPSGFYLSPQLEINHLQASGNKQDFTTYGVKGLFGYHWIIADSLSLHWGGGIQYLKSEGGEKDALLTGLPGGVWPTMEFGIGSAF